MSADAIQRAALGVALVCVLAHDAAATPAVMVRIDGCPDDEARGIEHAIAVELAPIALGPPVAEIVVTCIGARRVITIVDWLTSKRVERVEQHGEDPRVVGLVVAELLAASWLELNARLATASDAVEFAHRVLPGRPAARELAIGIAGFTRTQRELGTVGAMVRIALARGRWRTAVDASFEHGTSQVLGGDVTATVGSLGLAVGPMASTGSFFASAGLGVRSGALVLDGDVHMGAPLAGIRAVRPWVAATATGELAVETGSLRITLALEVGYSVVSTVAVSELVGRVRWGGWSAAPAIGAALAW